MKKFGLVKNKKILLSLAIVILLSAWILWGNRAIQISEYEVKSSKIPEAFEGFTIVQISDLHNAEFGEGQDMLFSKIEKCEPDMIAITGDLIDSNRTDVDVAMEFIEGAVKLAPVYFVTGNHEVWAQTTEYEELAERMAAAGVVMMDGQVCKIEKDGASVFLQGVKDASTVIKENAGAEVDERPAFMILLAHRPELFERYAAADVDLVLTGHAHGGQFRIPFIGGVIAPDQGIFPEYDAGMFVENNTHMIVSRGLGNSVFPFRVNNRPEIVVVRLFV